MKHLFNHSKFLKIAAFSIIAVIITTSAFSFTSSTTTTAENYFPVAQVGLGITAVTKAKLLSAFRAQYGKNASVSEIKLVEKAGATWLFFMGGGDGTPTVGIKLVNVSGYFSIDLAGPVGVKVWLPDGDCSCCDTDGNCSWKNGHQVDCGNDPCKLEEPKLPSKMKTVLAAG